MAQSSFTDRAVTLRARNGPTLEIGDASVVTTFYLSAQFFKSGQWLVIRPGTSGVVLTSDIGLRALKRFRSGATPDQVKRDIAHVSGCPPDRINLRTLLETAASAGMLKTVDGTLVDAPRIDVGRLGLHWFKMWLYPVLLAVGNRLPFRISEPWLFHLQWFAEGRFVHDSGKAHVLANLRRLFPSAPASELEAVTTRFYRAKVRQNLAFLLTSRPVKRVSRWLSRFVEPDPSGLDCFTAAVAAGRGAIVVSFHFGSYWLLPAMLVKLGMPVHVLTGSRPGRRRIEVDQPDSPAAAITFYGRTPHDLAALSRAAAAGAVVVMFADTQRTGETPEQQFVHGTWGRMARHGSDVTVLGHPFPVDSCAGWLHASTGAPVFPAVLYPVSSRWKVRLEFGERVVGSESEITGRVYAQMERWIQRHPEQWAHLTTYPEPR